MFARIFRIVLVEGYKITRQNLLYIALALICLAVLGSVCADKIFTSADEPTSGFTVLARAALNGFKIGAILLLIFGSLMIAGEMTSGTIKMVLIRPYRRSEWILAKALTLMILVLVTMVVVEILGLLVVWQAYGFTDVADPIIKDYIHLEKAIMLRYLVYSFVLVILPLIAIALLGLFISSLLEHVGSAVALAILFYLALDYLVIGLFDNLAPYCFTYYLDWYLVTCGDLAQGILGEISKFQAIDQILGFEVSGEVDTIPLIKSIVVPLGYSLIFGLASLVVFKRKDILV